MISRKYSKFGLFFSGIILFSITAKLRAEENRLFGLDQAVIPEEAKKLISSMVSVEALTIPFGSTKDDFLKLLTEAELDKHIREGSWLAFDDEYLLNRLEYLYTDGKLSAVRCYADKKPSRKTINDSLSGLIKVLGRPSKTLVATPEEWKRNHKIMFQWDVPEGTIVFFHYTGSGGYYGRLWFRSKLSEAKVWNFKGVEEVKKGQSLSELWKNWLDDVIGPS